MFSPRTVNQAESIQKSAPIIVITMVVLFLMVIFVNSKERTYVSNTPTGSPVPPDTPMAQLVDTPSQNISCELHDDFVGCSIRYRVYQEYGLDDCDSELYSIKLSSETEIPQIVCGEQYLGNPGDYVHRLEYGSSAYFDDFACTAEETGLKCWKQSTGSGFRLSEENYETF